LLLWRGRKRWGVGYASRRGREMRGVDWAFNKCRVQPAYLISTGKSTIVRVYRAGACSGKVSVGRRHKSPEYSPTTVGALGRVLGSLIASEIPCIGPDWSRQSGPMLTEMVLWRIL
jgi:hypothetical protein